MKSLRSRAKLSRSSENTGLPLGRRGRVWGVSGFAWEYLTRAGGPAPAALGEHLAEAGITWDCAGTHSTSIPGEHPFISMTSRSDFLRKLPGLVSEHLARAESAQPHLRTSGQSLIGYGAVRWTAPRKLDLVIGFLLPGSISVLSSSKASQVQRERLVELFEDGWGFTAAAREVGVGVKTARNLWDRWRLHGRLALMRKPSQAFYSFETKLEAVKRFLAGQTKPHIAKDMGLSSPKVLERWIRAYRVHGEDGLRPKPKGRPPKASSLAAGGVSELEMLQRRVEYLEAENAYLKALRDLMNNES